MPRIILLTTFALTLAGTNAQAQESSDSEVLEEITVTGSRLARTGYDTPVPISVIGENEIDESGFSNIYDVLKYSPSLGIGLGSSNGNFSADAGASFANLRGLGTSRTLVLVDGRRRVSGSSESSAVDLSTIPAAMIERVETITGGASAVYGADAVTGVVNIILKNDFDGVEVRVDAGQSTDGSGGERVAAELLVGSPFDGGKGSFTAGFSHSQEDPLMGFQREFSELPLFAFTNPDNTGPNDGIFDQIHYDDNRFPNTHYGGTFRVGGVHYTVDPGLREVRNGSPLLFGFLASDGGDGFDGAEFSQLRMEQETRSTLLNVNYSLNDKVRLFLESGFTNTVAVDRTQPSFDFALPLLRENPLLPADVQTLMDAEGVTDLAIGRTNVDLGIVVNDRERNSWTVVTGLEGDLPNGWSWTASYQQGRYTSSERKSNSRVNSRFLNAIDVVSDPLSGEPVCRDVAARAAGCVPLSILGRDQATPDAQAYINVTAQRSLENKQEVYSAIFNGPGFSLPAGPSQFAAGIEYRSEELSFSDDPLGQSGDLFFLSAGVPNIDADFDVTEAFFEALIPLLSDKAAAQDLSVEAAVRYSDYDTIGDTTAWKVALNWQINDSARFRLIRSDSVRAPNLIELFGPGVGALLIFPDPCDLSVIDNGSPTREANCLALGMPDGYEDTTLSTYPVVTSGNPGLTEETSESWTAGIVFTPAFADRLSVSVDYWNIDIEDAVSTIDASQILNRCVDSASINNPFCPLVTRDPALFEVTRIDVRNINVGSLTASGIDIQAEYSLDVGNGELGFRLLATYLNDNEEQIDVSDPSSLNINVGEVQNPEWRGTLTTRYDTGALGVSLAARYVGNAKVDVQLSDEGLDRNDVSSRLYLDLTAAYDFTDRFQVSGGINNLTNQDPPKVVGADLLNPIFIGANGHYENLGRYLHLAAKYRF